MSLRTINLNLLPILRALLAEASVTRAATSLGLSQPAASNALNRLRDLLGDPLLVSFGRTMHLTPKAKQLQPMIETICESIETALLGNDFIPATAERAFVVASPDYIAALLGPPLLFKLTESAPGIVLSFVDVPSDLRRPLVTGDIDVAIVAHDDRGMRGLSVGAGYTDQLVGVVAADHPLAPAGPSSAANLHAYPRIALDLGKHGLRSPSGLAEMVIGVGDKPQLTASHLRVLPLLVAQSQGVAVMPRALARQAAQMLAVAYFDLPTPSPPIDICLVWGPAANPDPAHLWLREQLATAMRLHFDRLPPEGDGRRG